MKRVAVLGAQVPFVRGGAELLNESLVKEINKLDGIQAELIQLPFKWYPEEQMLNDIAAWRLLDLSESCGKKIDLVIPTKFPTYAAQHSNKILWLVHQHRVLYDLENTEFDYPEEIKRQSNSDIIRNKIRKIDVDFISESVKKYTIADNVTARLQNFNGIRAETLYPPAPFADKIVSGDYGDYVLFIGRIEKMKRADLLVKAMMLSSKKTKAYFIGTGSESDNLQALIEANKLTDRCKMLGYVSEEELSNYLAHCKAVFYAPYDEDYGYATIEAFLAKKPVITCYDSGEVATLVQNTESGFVVENKPEAIAHTLKKLYELSPSQLKKMARNGYDFAKSISWNNVLEKLVLENI
ncbi:MAG: glycosyltransferase family 4 protein [Methylococcales bacterium]|nr:glycosyltransferase family 4 protein [Methylococcales bacterium]